MYSTEKSNEDGHADKNMKEENKKRVVEFDEIIRKKGGI